MSYPLPTIVFLAGAFAAPTCFDDLAAEFKKAGYPTKYSSVPSLNPEDPTAVTTSKDAEYVRQQLLLPLLEEDKDVVLFVHSYGGAVGGAAAAGLSKSSRSTEGKRGGVIGLLYVAGNIMNEGESLKEAMGGSYPPFLKEDYGLAVIDPVMETLYNDVDVSRKQQLEQAMIPHAVAAFETPAPRPAWAESTFDGRRAYIRTLRDQCIPPFVQDLWIQKSGVSWDTIDVDASHCPFISRVGDLANVSIKLFEKWAK